MGTSRVAGCDNRVSVAPLAPGPTTGRAWLCGVERHRRLPTKGATVNAPRRELWTPIAGIAAAVTFVVGVAMAANSPDSDSSDLKVLAWYAKHSHRVGVIVGVFVLMFFGLFLLWFAAGLRNRLRAAEGPDGRLANVSFGGALLCVALVWTGAFALAAVPAGISLGSEP